MTGTEQAAVLTRDLPLRVIDISASGCLIVSRRLVAVGTVGRLRLKLGTEECADDIQVVRCEAVDDGRSLFHVGVRFLWTTPRDVGSIRHAVTRHAPSLDSTPPVRLM